MASRLPWQETKSSSLIAMQPPESAALSTPASVESIQAPAGEIVAFTAGAFAPAPNELDEWKKLTDAERERINLLLSCFQRMAAGNVRAQSLVLAMQLSHLRGYSAETLVRLYYAFKAQGWRGLVRGYSGPQQVPDEFKEWFRAQCLKNSRSIRAQIDIVRRLWEAGESIPGYGTWQEWFLTKMPDRDLPSRCPGYPKGWSQSTFYTMQPPKAERALATRGYAAAKKDMASMVRDPSGLLPLQFVVIDDFETDQLCAYERQIRRMAGLLAMDVATRRKLKIGMKPRVENSDTGRMEAINRNEVRYLIYSLIAEWGLPMEYPMTIICENASAAIEKELQDAMKGLFGGRIRVTRTGLIDCRTVENGFVQGGGKPWEKGWIESAFNLMHNTAAVLPGQKGANYTKKPAELAAKVLYAERLLSTGQQGLNLTDEEVARIKLPFMSAEEMISAYEIVFRLMESRTDHKLLGFDTVQEWRLDEAHNWESMEKLALVPCEQHEGLAVRERMESPLERWEKLNRRADCQRVKIDEAALAALLLTPKKAKLRNGRVTFTHNKVGYTFADQAAYVLNEREGEDVTAFFDEQNPDRVHIFNAKGAFVQTIKRLGPVDITNPVAMRQTAAAIKTLENQTFAAVREKTQDQAREIAGMVANNEAVAPGLHLDPKLRKALGLRVDEAKAILPAPSVTATLAAAKKAGPIARDAFAPAIALTAAATQAAEEKASAKTMQRIGNDASDLIDEPEDMPETTAHDSGAEELL